MVAAVIAGVRASAMNLYRVSNLCISLALLNCRWHNLPKMAAANSRLSGTRTLGNLRAVEALEHIGTPVAKQLLEDLAKGDPDAQLTRDAKATLKRLAARK
jgi:hypothetical protein